MVWFGLFLFPRSHKMFNCKKKRIQNRTKVPISCVFWGIGFVFSGLEPNDNFVGQDNLQLPRANEHIA